MLRLVYYIRAGGFVLLGKKISLSAGKGDDILFKKIKVISSAVK